MTKSKETHQDWAKRFHVACGYEPTLVADCPKCGDTFEYPKGETPAPQGTFCPSCKGGLKGVLHFMPSEDCPTFLNPQDILDEVMKWENVDEFMRKCEFTHLIVIVPLGNGKYNNKYTIDTDIITERPPTLLLKEATLFREGKK